MFFYCAAWKTSPICKISTFFEDLSFLNLRSHLNSFRKKNKHLTKRKKLTWYPNISLQGFWKRPLPIQFRNVTNYLTKDEWMQYETTIFRYKLTRDGNTIKKFIEQCVFVAVTFKGLWVVSFQIKWKNVWYTLVCLSSLSISRGKTTQ